MAFAIRETVAITTDASGNATEYTGVMNGMVQCIVYTKTDFTNCTVLVTTEDTGQTVWSQGSVAASATKRPLQAAHGTDGTAAEYASGYPVEVPVWAINERIKIVIASGGNTKTGTIDVVVGG